MAAPLRVAGRVLGRVRHHPQLAGARSESAKICGFVPMQGSNAHREELLLVNGTPEIGLKFDDGLPADPHRLDNAVTFPRHELWTGVTVRIQELIDTL